ncbi:arginine N-succinyltransferase [Bacteriovorax sp. Seq25_V]|uniref:arginine N-succinyltransferase n=1 Tax=Bacteriovorax sp. Seq25_V TaxID=1201288 RepID=UPI00038A5322|nr:arginine N-succinyltransferase [Bacteriovorax sp. Seq25_V]EQC43446.1 arginine N-succinyltransferase, alpha or beta subunit [Bacteriovorax sp. Seq25_V]
MFRLRSVALEDLNDLYELSLLYTFINLPADKELIENKIKSSLQSFLDPDDDFSENHYIFVLEDLATNKVIGCSMIHSQHGTEDEPHFFLKVSQENKFSQSINTGFIHGTLKLGIDTDGPTEIGGLILNPDYRGNPMKLGKQLSFVRFLYMAIFPERFKSTIHSELMPPFDRDGKSPLWEAIGRRFLNMEYHDADILSRKNKEFILSLFPTGTIYETLLPIEARNAVGKVGKDTLPVKNMLESIGFEYNHEVDPFDGGPHYRCELKDLKPVKELFKATISFADSPKSSWFLVHLNKSPYSFEAVCVKGNRDGENLIINSKFKSLFKDVDGAQTFTTIPI